MPGLKPIGLRAAHLLRDRWQKPLGFRWAGNRLSRTYQQPLLAPHHKQVRHRGRLHLGTLVGCLGRIGLR